MPDLPADPCRGGTRSANRGVYAVADGRAVKMQQLDVNAELGLGLTANLAQHQHPDTVRAIHHVREKTDEIRRNCTRRRDEAAPVRRMRECLDGYRACVRPLVRLRNQLSRQRRVKGVDNLVLPPDSTAQEVESGVPHLRICRAAGRRNLADKVKRSDKLRLGRIFSIRAVPDALGQLGVPAPDAWDHVRPLADERQRGVLFAQHVTPPRLP